MNRRFSGAIVSLAALLAGAPLTGCSTVSAMNPVNWWHRQEGGKIAEQRPAPPGADAPYPNLASVPNRPEPPDKDEMKKLTDSLIADRVNAQHAAQAAPLADPSSPSASPTLFGVGSAPPPLPAVTSTQSPPGRTGGPAASGSPPAASASLPAVSAPPPPATPPIPSPAPRRSVQSAPLADTVPSAAPSTPSQPAPEASASGQAATIATRPAGATGGGAPSDAAQVATAPPATNAQTQPALPPGPPPRPLAAGAPPPPAPTTAPPMPTSGTGSANIVFVAGSSELMKPAADEVKAFAAKRGNAVISVTGYGDSTSGDPAAQSAAVTLGLARAQAIFSALQADGVPPEAIRVNAEASGRGAALRLLQ